MSRIMDTAKKALDRKDKEAREMEYRQRMNKDKRSAKVQEHYTTWDDYCWFENPKNGFSLFTKEEYEEMVYQDEVHQAEMEAENAWLRKAESASYEDMAFERWEWERMYT